VSENWRKKRAFEGSAGNAGFSVKSRVTSFEKVNAGQEHEAAMIALFQELFHYQAYADALLLTAIRRHDVASKDQELRTLLHHILIAHRFWLHLSQRMPFFAEAENVVPATLDEIIRGYQQTQVQEDAWLKQLDESDLIRTVESPYLANRKVAVSEGLMQVCLHSQWHRAQCATRFRMLGGEPPSLDYILWVKERPDPIWPCRAPD
jgi:uncharacterized damage-inducible protein DinB